MSVFDHGVVDHLARAPANVLRELIQLGMDNPDLISFAGGLPAEELFDVEGLKAASRAVFGSNARTPLQYNMTEGLASLRERLAELCRTRGIGVEAGDLVVTSGSQQAIDVTVRCLVAPGDAVLVERPTFITALQTFRAAQAEMVGFETDGEGPVPESVEAALDEARRAGRRVKLIYLVPTFSNPAGLVTSLERRRALLALAMSHGVTILEDDPYGELWFDRAPPPSIRALADADPEAARHVIHVSSLSKTVSPGLRLGWAVLPRELMQPFKLMKSTADIHSSVLSQAVADGYLSLERLAVRLPLLRRSYAAKAKALAGALARHAPELSFASPEGGMFLWAQLPSHIEAVPFARHCAREAGVSVVPGDPFYPSAPSRHHLRLSFSQGSAERIERGVERLGAALRAFHTRIV